MLQVQRVRNVAVPSNKQFSGGSGRRLLRVQLTDGRVTVAGVEIEGGIPNLRSATHSHTCTYTLPLTHINLLSSRRQPLPHTLTYFYMSHLSCVCVYI